MRVRILKSTQGIIDRVALSQLVPNLSYDVPDSVGRYLLACGCAAELPSSQPALIVPLDEAGVFDAISGGVHVERSEAADRSPRRRRRQTRR